MRNRREFIALSANAAFAAAIASKADAAPAAAEGDWRNRQSMTGKDAGAWSLYISEFRPEDFPGLSTKTPVT